MPSNFDAEKYAAEVRAMDANALLEEWYVRRWRIDESGVEWDYERISKDELLRRLNPGRVDRERLAEMMRESNCATLLLSESHELGAWFADLIESGKLPREGE